MYNDNGVGAEDVSLSIPTIAQSTIQSVRDWMGNNMMIYLIGAGILAYVITNKYSK